MKRRGFLGSLLGLPAAVAAVVKAPAVAAAPRPSLTIPAEDVLPSRPRVAQSARTGLCATWASACTLSEIEDFEEPGK